MLEALRREIPTLTTAAVLARAGDTRSPGVAATAAAARVRAPRNRARSTGRGAARRAAAANRARRTPGPEAVEGELRALVTRAQDLPIAAYDELSAERVTARLPALSQTQLRTVARYERRHRKRATVLARIHALREHEPWTGYDEQPLEALVARLRDADDETLQRVRHYEARHRRRREILDQLAGRPDTP